MALEPKEKIEMFSLDSTNNPFQESQKNTHKHNKEAQQPTSSELERLIDFLIEEKLQTEKLLEKKSDEAEALHNEVVELQRVNEDCLLELKVLGMERKGLVQEKMYDRRRFDSINSRLSEAKKGLEERLHRNTRTTQVFIEQVFSVLNCSIDMMGECEDGKDDEEKEEEDVKGEVIDVGVKDMEEEMIMIQQYEIKLKAMERALRRKEEKMEDVKRGMDFLKASLAEARKEKSG
ncbi:hypothetical protein MRB53_004745 [Persea americana]|uniref:Uncharacterized protein n=1 Tax=Persea americana TaxID=3435 RepID=A0ACC2MBE4_PERAE|nr:hypothetical protein MRB53_004745 [Persea americana]